MEHKINGTTADTILIDELAGMELQAAKQLLMELKMLKQKAYGRGTLVTSVLIVQIKQVLRGLMKKYNDAGLLIGENVTLRLSDRTKYASIDFIYSQGLRALMDEVMAEIKGMHAAMSAAQAAKEVTNEPIAA